jgi:hypothetical protein
VAGAEGAGDEPLGVLAAVEQGGQQPDGGGAQFGARDVEAGGAGLVGQVGRR